MAKMKTWRDPQTIESQTYDCSWCESRVSTTRGLSTTDGSSWFFLICSNCGKPTIKTQEASIPNTPYGEQVNHVSDEINHLYCESRQAVSVNAPTASIMACRKILLNLAVHHADLLEKNENGFGPSFKKCVEHLVEKQLPPAMKPWLETVQRIGNEANHEIKQASIDDAKLLIDFVCQILKVMFEMPARVPTAKPAENP